MIFARAAENGHEKAKIKIDAYEQEENQEAHNQDETYELEENLEENSLENAISNELDDLQDSFGKLGM